MDRTDQNIFDREFLLDVIDGSDAHIYIMELESYKILYMNQALRKEFQLENPIGKICWQVLQRDMNGPCDFCRIPEILEGDGDSCLWSQLNSVTGRVYQNYDRIVEKNGKQYFIRSASDVTNLALLSENATQDELTSMLNRRTGQKRLEEMLQQARTESKVLTLVLCDLNELKQINDLYGHLEGDRVLRYVADILKEQVSAEDLLYRLSGDEFVLAFYGKDQAQVEKKVENIQYRLRMERERHAIFYGVSCSCGIVEEFPEDGHTLNELIAAVDRRMYEQKRKYHIDREKAKLFAPTSPKELASFSYNKDRLYEALCASADDYPFVGNMKTKVFRYPPAMVKEFGLPGEIVENAAAFWSELIHPEDEEVFLVSNQEIADGRAESHDIEYRAKNVHGEWIWLRCRGRMIRGSDGKPDLFAGFIINQGKNNSTDQLTGLHNKYAFEGAIKKALTERPDDQLCVMALDIDEFKNINNRYDRAFDDEVLRITAQKIRAMLMPEAKLFRLDGASFGILLGGGEREKALQLFNRMQDAFCKQQEYQGRKYFYTVSAGCATYPQHGKNYLELSKHASNAMEYSKIMGKNRITFFTPDIVKGKERKLAMLEELRSSVERNFCGFSVVYQPQVDPKTGGIYGAEALARWKNSRFGVVSPSEFIPLMEENGMIPALGKWVFEQAACCCKVWCEMGYDFHMSVNLSYLQLLEENLAETLNKILENMQLAPEHMILELTEGYMIRNDAGLKRALQRILDSGMGLALDDYGTGYSALLSLSELPVSTVKIDRRFTEKIDENLFNSTAVKAITALSHGIGKRVCIEGVETEAQNCAAKACGAELVQGFYYGKPEPAEIFADKYLKERE